MNTEYLVWFGLLVVVGLGTVLYLALGAVPAIPEAEAPGTRSPEARSLEARPAATEPDRPAPEHARSPGAAHEAPGAALETPGAQSSPVRTTEPGPEPSTGTTDTP